MTDEELIARLRQQDGWVTLEAHTHLTAAARIEQLADELHTMKTGGIIEVANRNNRVTEYMFYWEGRALEAEAKLEESEAKLSECEARLGKAVELLRKHCDIWAMNDFDAADLEALIGEQP